MTYSDKLKHLICGMALGLATYFSGYILFGVIISTFIFFAKEVYDIYKPNPTGFDWFDIAADYFGYSILIILLL